MTGHDSSVNIVYPSGPDAPPQAFISVRSPSLPYLSLTFISESSIIAAGHDCQPILLTGSSSGWSVSGSLDEGASGSKAAGGAGGGGRVVSGGAPGRLNNEAFNMFKQADSRGISSKPAGGAVTATGATAVGADGLLVTVHQNSITQVGAYEWDAQGDVGKVFTRGRDGKLVIWATDKGVLGKLANMSV